MLEERLNPLPSQVPADASGSEGNVLIPVGHPRPAAVDQTYTGYAIENHVWQARITMCEHLAFAFRTIPLQLLQQLQRRTTATLFIKIVFIN